MWLLKLILIVETLFLIAYEVVGANPWCDRKYECVSRSTGMMCKHTMCQYEEPGPQCGQWRHDLTDGERAFILDMHNKIRAKVANGKMDKQPGATNMMRMEWDDDAEKIAQRWASQCKINGHDDCRDSWTGERTGQNIAWKFYGRSWGSQDSNRIPDLKSMVHDQWVKSEVVNMQPWYVSSYPLNSPKIGHYTQAVWAETTRIGCGLAQLLIRQNGMLTWEYKLVCNYISHGNFIGQPVYLQGDKPATQCPSGAGPSEKYPGLCEYKKIYNDYGDKLVDRFDDLEESPNPTQQAVPVHMDHVLQTQPPFRPITTPLTKPVKEPAKSSPTPSLQTQPNRINTTPVRQPSYSLRYITDIDWGKFPIIGRWFSNSPAPPPTVNTPNKNPRLSPVNQANPQVRPNPALAPANALKPQNVIHTHWKPVKNLGSPVTEYPNNSGPKDPTNGMYMHEYASKTPKDELIDKPINDMHDYAKPTHIHEVNHRFPVLDTYENSDDPYEFMRRSQDDFHRMVQARHADMMRRLGNFR